MIKCSVCSLELPKVITCEECKHIHCADCLYLNDNKCSQCNLEQQVSEEEVIIPQRVSELTYLNGEEEVIISPPQRVSELTYLRGEEEVIIPPPQRISELTYLKREEDKKIDVFMDSKIRLPNIGNSCYINSALQVCLHSKRLWKECCEVIGDQYFIQFLPAVTKIRELYTEANKINVWEQCDSVSIFRFLLDKINDLYPKGFNPLYGLCLHSQYKCLSCKHVAHQRQFESVYCVIPNGEHKCLQDMIHMDFKRTEIEYKCGKCENKKAVRSVQLESIPEYIFLSIQHIGNDVDFTIEECIEINSIEYELYGCIEHLGRSEHGGHYISYFKDSQNTVHIFDDDRNDPIPEDMWNDKRRQNRRDIMQIMLVWYHIK